MNIKSFDQLNSLELDTLREIGGTHHFAGSADHGL